MTEPGKPSWGNRIIIAIFVVLGVITIAGTIISTVHEWNAGDVAGPEASEDIPPVDIDQAGQTEPVDDADAESQSSF